MSRGLGCTARCPFRPWPGSVAASAVQPQFLPGPQRWAQLVSWAGTGLAGT